MVAGGVAELSGISDPVFPTKSSRVPLARLKILTIGLLYLVVLEACQRHAATLRAENLLKLEFCNTPGCRDFARPALDNRISNDLLFGVLRYTDGERSQF